MEMEPLDAEALLREVAPDPLLIEQMLRDCDEASRALLADFGLLLDAGRQPDKT